MALTNKIQRSSKVKQNQAVISKDCKWKLMKRLEDLKKNFLPLEELSAELHFTEKRGKGEETLKKFKHLCLAVNKDHFS